MSKDLDIIAQARIDQSEDAIKKIKRDIEIIEGRIKDTTVKVNLEINKSETEAIKQQFQDIQKEMQQIKKQANFKPVTDEMKQATVNGKKVESTLSQIREQANLISKSTKLDLVDGKTLENQHTYQNNLLETIKIIETYDGSGLTRTKTQTNSIKRLEVQKSLYNQLKSLNNDILSIEKQKIKASDTDLAKLNQQQSGLSAVATEVQETLNRYQLVNPELQKQIELTQQLKQTQIEIAQTKNVDAQSKKAYAELSKLAKEEYRIKQNMVGQEGRLLELSQQRLNIVMQAQTDVGAQVSQDRLFNQERHNALLETRDKLKLDLLSKEEKLAQKEQVRIDKLNEKMSDVDFEQISFDDDEAVQKYALSLQGAGAQVTKFQRKLANGKHRQVEMTIATQTANDKFKEQKIVLDENSKGLYKVSEAQREVSNRNLSMAKQMQIAITRSIQWGTAMSILYGNLRKLREGIEIVTNLDKELTQVAIITGKTREETKQLAIEYAQLGKEMGKTAAEISKVNTELIRQGLSADESYKRMQTILKLSATGNLGAEQTMSIITSSVNALGEESEKTADVLLKAGNISASSVEDIGEALTKTASSARATGYTLEQLGATISTLTEVTQESPSSLGNSLKTLLARFNKINQETGETNEVFNDVQKAFESVGVQFLDTEGQIRPVYQLLTELSTKWEDLDKNTKMYLATTSAGKQILMPVSIAI